MARTRDETVIEEARRRFKLCVEAEDKQRKVILQCKQFRALDQWPDEIKIQRQGGPAIQGQAAQPPRPMLTIDRISQPTRQVSNSVKAANFAINVQPNGYGADSDTAEICKGLLRWIQNRARAESPIDWAADGAAEGGIGWFRLYAEYVSDADPGDVSFDQDLCLGRITNNLSVYCDPSARKPTRADARFMFVTETVPKDEFERLWPNADVTTLDEFRATGDQDGWVTEDSVRIAEYWTLDYEEETIVEWKTPAGVRVVPKSVLPDGTPKEQIGQSRVVHRPVVTCRKITAVEELERWDWPGRRIPLFPVLGEELNVDGQIILRGVIAAAMDAQRMVNYMYSAAVEAVALAPKAPFVVAEGQVEKYAPIWQNANRFNYSYLPYTPVSLLGQPVSPPQRDQAEAAGLQSMVVMLERSEEGIKAATGIYDPSLGNTNPREKSGRAIMALQQQAELGQSNYIDNVVLTLTEVGDELMYLLPKYYDRPGRIVQILGVDDQPKQVMLGVPYQDSPNGPKPAPDVTPEMAKLQKGLAKFYDFSRGRYATTVSVGKDYTTKRNEGAQMLGDMLAKNPQLLQVFGDLYFRDLDFPGSQEISDRMKHLLSQPIQQAEQGQQADPQQLQQQLQQMQQMMKMLTDELTAKTKALETDQIKAERDLELEKLKQSGDTQRELLKGQAEFQLEKLKIAADLLKTRATLEQQQTESLIDRELGQLDTALTHVSAERDRQHEADQADLERTHQRDIAQMTKSVQNSESA